VLDGACSRDTSIGVGNSEEVGSEVMVAEDVSTVADFEASAPVRQMCKLVFRHPPSAGSVLEPCSLITRKTNGSVRSVLSAETCLWYQLMAWFAMVIGSVHIQAGKWWNSELTSQLHRIKSLLMSLPGTYGDMILGFERAMR
jgi:hypothetical protein